MTKPSDTAPVVWLLTDNKVGHRNQLKGLGNRLRVLCGASLHWVDTTTVPVPLWRALIGVPPPLVPSLPRPTLIIAAGTGTHRLLLALRRFRKARTVVVMKPAFPLRWVDAAIIPNHDGVRTSRRVLLTMGMMNAMTPMAQVSAKREALVLIGGPSRHYQWDDALIFDQILQLMGHYPEWRWTISSSRRTPLALRTRLDTLSGLKVTVVNPDHTHEDWLAHTLSASRAVWVTPDSSSMVCEAITTGVPTGLFELTPNPSSRIARSQATLIASGRVAGWRDHPAVMGSQRQPSERFWESDRSARWLIRTFLTRGAS